MEVKPERLSHSHECLSYLINQPSPACVCVGMDKASILNMAVVESISSSLGLHCRSLPCLSKKKAVANLTPVPNRLLPVINSPVIHKALTWTKDKEMSIVRWTDPTDSRGGSHQSKDSRVCVDQREHGGEED